MQMMLCAKRENIKNDSFQRDLFLQPVPNCGMYLCRGAAIRRLVLLVLTVIP